MYIIDINWVDRDGRFSKFISSSSHHHLFAVRNINTWSMVCWTTAAVRLVRLDTRSSCLYRLHVYCYTATCTALRERLWLIHWMIFCTVLKNTSSGNLTLLKVFYWHHTVLIMLTAPDMILETSNKHFSTFLQVLTVRYKSTYIRLPVVIYWYDLTDGILHFVFVSPVALTWTFQSRIYQVVSTTIGTFPFLQ